MALELTDAGFDASVLSEFRHRLITGATDSTQILAAVRTINKDQVHWGATCGYEADRDVHAAFTMKRLGSSRQARTLPMGGVV